MPRTRLEYLDEMFLAALDGRPPAVEVREWLVRGVLAYLREGGRLDDALGLATCGREHSSRLVARANRDARLLAAARALCGASNVSTWEQACRLAREVKAFSRLPPLSQPPAHWSLCRRHLWQASLTGVPLPESERALFRLLSARPAAALAVCSYV